MSNERNAPARGSKLDTAAELKRQLTGFQRAFEFGVIGRDLTPGARWMYLHQIALLIAGLDRVPDDTIAAQKELDTLAETFNKGV